MKWIDLPPIWLAAAIAATIGLNRSDPWGLSFGGAWSDFAAGLLIGGGVVLMALAVVEMRKWRTTIIPHQQAAHLVTSGIFKRTRNPIYVGDVLVLLGVILLVDAPLALPLLPIFVWVIERRFILPEEDRLRRTFRQDFYRYTQKTRRWI